MSDDTTAAVAHRDMGALQVAVAELVVKLDALSESMKFSVERLIEKIDTGDRQGAQLFRLIEERLSSYQSAQDPKLVELRRLLDELSHKGDTRHDRLQTHLDSLEGWRNRIIGGMGVAAAVGGGIGAAVAKAFG